MGTTSKNSDTHLIHVYINVCGWLAFGKLENLFTINLEI